MNAPNINMLLQNKAIRVYELSYEYEQHIAVNALTFDVLEGSIFGLLGPNGAGKSTLLKMLTTLLPPTSGTACIMGKDIVTQPCEVRKEIGYVPQKLSADGELTGYENLLIATKLYGIPRDKAEARISELLHFTGLGASAELLVKKYSGGMVRRLEIAQALVHDPRVLFLDEPTVGFDPSARKLFWEYLRCWQKEKNTTIVMTTHDMHEAEANCDLVAFLYLGSIVAMDSPHNLKFELGLKATLEDVFIHYTGQSLQQGDIRNARSISSKINQF